MTPLTEFSGVEMWCVVGGPGTDGKGAWNVFSLPITDVFSR